MATPLPDPSRQTSGQTSVLAFSRAAPSLRGVLAAALKRHRLPELLMETLIRDAQFWSNETPEIALARALANRLRIAPIDFQKARGILLLGPTGAGKSAVAAKIAHHALLSGRKVERASAMDGMALFRTATFDSDSLMVMEASGFNPVNRRALSAFAALSEAQGVDSIGVVCAASDAQDVSEIVAGLRAPRVIVTGLDRTARLGATLAAVTGAALAHVTHGPRADDGLETLNPADLANALLN